MNGHYSNRLSLAVAAVLLLEACHSSSDDPSPAPTPNPTSAGLDARPSNLTCVAPAKAPAGGTTIALQQVFSNLSFSEPVGMLQAPGDSSRWYVLQKGGTVRVFANTASPTASTFISIPVNAGGEGGLLGMAFHPNWATNRQVFLSFTEGSPMTSVIARYTVSANGLTADPNTRVNVLRVPQPPAQLENHKGGHIAFGPDGFLYFGLGDGGGSGDEYRTGQDTTDLHGSMLRIDVDRGTPYAIPPSNPFASSPGGICDNRPYTNATGNCPEIYAWGLRNPWR